MFLFTALFVIEVNSQAMVIGFHALRIYPQFRHFPFLWKSCYYLNYKCNHVVNES